MTTQIREGTHPTNSNLEAVLPSWCAIGPIPALCCLTLVASFLYFSYVPVSAASTWHDIATGASQNSQLQLPLSTGMRQINIGTIGTQLIHNIYVWFGVTGISVAFAVLQTLNLVLLSLIVYRLSRRWLLTLATPVLITLAGLFEFDGLSRATVGLLFLCLLFLLLTSHQTAKQRYVYWSQASWKYWLGCILLFAGWANFHATFVFGLAILLLFALGSLSDGQRYAVWNNAEFKSRIWLFELALFATLLTPDTLFLWKSVCWYPDNPVIQQLGGWAPTTLAGWHGAALALGWAGWVIASRFTDRIPVATSSIAFALTIMTAACTACIQWFAPIMLIAIADLLPKIEQTTTDGNREARESMTVASLADDKRPLRFVFSLLAVLFLWIGFCLSPVGGLAFGKSSRTTQQTIGDAIPMAAVTYLEQDERPGMVFSPSYWGDWIVCRVERPVFANHSMERLPAKAATDYRQIFSGSSNWSKLLDQYAIKTLVIDKRQQPELFRQLRINKNRDWTIEFENSLTIVAGRESK